MNNNIFKISKKYENGKMVSSIYNETNKYFKHIPIISNCVIDPLKVDIVFQNDSGISFLNRNAFDLDVTCYIDDEIEKDRKVGYGNSYKRTEFLYWEGDETEGGKETINVDVNKYIKKKLLNKETNTTLKIVFNICWNENSEITTSNTYALIHWNNLLEKYPINVCGLNTLSCNTKSFEINIDMNTRELYFVESKLYPVISINYKEKLKGYDAEPDIKLGIINLTENDIYALESKDWIKFSNEIYYKKENNSIYYLLTNENYQIEKNNNPSLNNLYKSLISNLFYIINGEEKIESKEFILDQIFFGIEYNDNKENEIDFNYVIYLNPSKFKSIKKLKYKINAILHDEIGILSYELTEKE